MSNRDQKRKKKLMDNAYVSTGTVSLTKANKMFRAARRNLRKNNKKASKLQTKWQLEMAVAKALKEKTMAAAQIKKW